MTKNQQIKKTLSVRYQSQTYTSDLVEEKFL